MTEENTYTSYPVILRHSTPARRWQITYFIMNSLNIPQPPDSLAMLADYLNNGIKSVSVAKRPF